MISADPIDTLVELFPRLFRGQRPGSFSSLPEGWLKLASQLFDDLDRMLDGNNAPLFEVRQIKEKLCRLRVYFWLGPPFAAEDETAHRAWSPTREKVSDRIRVAGDESESTCQRCGAGDAPLRRPAELVTLCESCWTLRIANQDHHLLGGSSP